MTLDMRELYQETILDHNRKPRNFRKLEGACRTTEGFNPLCGDKVKIYLRIENDLVSDVSFEGSGCAISIAAASMMTESVKGRTLPAVQRLFEMFHTLLTAETAIGLESNELGKLMVFAGVREFPVRVKCATLPWHTLRAAIENKPETVSTDALPLSGRPSPTADRVREIENKVIEVLHTVHDPEIPVNIYDLGLIYGLAVEPAGTVAITMTLTAPGCPLAWMIMKEVDSKVRAIPGITDVKVDLTWDPPWTRDRMSEATKLQLGL
ncbi:MAG: Fe-S cluster assembly sulfur transfer protein SufU [Nitrospirota bacterium]|jgi:nitrogen fixation NifU-like protein